MIQKITHGKKSTSRYNNYTSFLLTPQHATKRSSKPASIGVPYCKKEEWNAKKVRIVGEILNCKHEKRNSGRDFRFEQSIYGNNSSKSCVNPRTNSKVFIEPKRSDLRTINERRSERRCIYKCTKYQEIWEGNGDTSLLRFIRPLLTPKPEIEGRNVRKVCEGERETLEAARWGRWRRR